MENIVNEKSHIWRFSLKYFLLFLLLLVIEIIIALYVRDNIIRPYGGDVLVVMLIYCFVKAFLDIKTLYLSIGVLLFAYCIEVAQYFNFVELLHLQDYKVARIILGTSFSWGDIISYTIGALFCVLLDKDKKNDTAS